MQLVDVLVKRTPVQSPVRPVVKHILKDEEEGDLSGHQERRGEGHLVCRHAEVAADRVKEVNEGEFAGEMGDEYDFGAFPDLLLRDRLVLRHTVSEAISCHRD